MKTYLIIPLLFSTTLAVTVERRQSTWTPGQRVETSSGPVIGQGVQARNSSFGQRSPTWNPPVEVRNRTSGGNVSEYLGIPYARAPIGNLRFAEPVKFEGNEVVNATSFGLSCPVTPDGLGTPSPEALARANLTGTAISVLAVLDNGNHPTGEDCLSLNVWTKPQVGEAKKAVMVWIHGGAFRSGSSAVPAYNGRHLADEQDVVVVSFNYRLGIFGFPGNPNSVNNLGLLDQRLAIEWVRDNIANFGGDPDRIIAFGQSSGASSAEFHTYAWSDDPIVKGIIAQSGTAFGWGLPSTANESATYWQGVTSALNCDFPRSKNSAEEELSCMRRVNITEILAEVPGSDSIESIQAGFIPAVDDKVIFANYSARTPAKVPVLIGNTHYESGYFRPLLAIAGTLSPDRAWNTLDLIAYTCPSALKAATSLRDGIRTWRYRYFGEFPNLTISLQSGSYHGAELPILFNTVPFVAVSATDEQLEIAYYLRTAWATFAKDPENGLEEYGWPLYNPAEDTVVRIAYENRTGPELINPRRYDAVCEELVKTPFNITNPPEFPDAGANVTPTGGAPAPTTSTGGPAPTTSTTPGAGGKLSAGVWSVSALMLASLVFFA